MDNINHHMKHDKTQNEKKQISHKQCELYVSRPL